MGMVCLAFGLKYSLQTFLESDPDELARNTRLLKPDIDIALQCVSNTFYPLSRRQTSGSLFPNCREIGVERNV